MSSHSSDATQTRHLMYVLLCGRKGRLGDWELKAECIFVSFLLCSLWDVKVYIVRVDILGTVYVFISGLCLCASVTVAQLHHVGMYFSFF